MSANTRQVGGTHYAASTQHWDMAIACKLGYMEGQITKYISRWRKKHGVQDLQKALHFLDKLIENWESLRPPLNLNREYLEGVLSRFVEENGIKGIEREIVCRVVLWRDGLELREAKASLERFIDWVLRMEALRQEPLGGPGSPEDGGHHSRQQEG